MAIIFHGNRDDPLYLGDIMQLILWHTICHIHDGVNIAECISITYKRKELLL